MSRNTSNELDELSRTIIRMQSWVLAVVCSAIGGVGLFAMTAWLIIKGGDNVGLHLQLLGHYFIGYSVTWKGSIVGLFYGALVGGGAGLLVGSIYNRIVQIRHHQS